MGNYCTCLVVITWRVLVQVMTVIFAASRSVPNICYIAHVDNCVVSVKWAFAMPACTCHVCLDGTSGIAFNPIADHSRSGKEIDPYFKSQPVIPQL